MNVKLDWSACVETLKPRGRLHLAGATLDPLDLSLFPLLMGQPTVSASPVGSPAVIAQMIEFAARHDIRRMEVPLRAATSLPFLMRSFSRSKVKNGF